MNSIGLKQELILLELSKFWAPDNNLGWIRRFGASDQSSNTLSNNLWQFDRSEQAFSSCLKLELINILPSWSFDTDKRWLGEQEIGCKVTLLCSYLMNLSQKPLMKMKCCKLCSCSTEKRWRAYMSPRIHTCWQYFYCL